VYDAALQHGMVKEEMLEMSKLGDLLPPGDNTPHRHPDEHAGSVKPGHRRRNIAIAVMAGIAVVLAATVAAIVSLSFNRDLTAQSSGQIASQARSAVRSARSVHVVGTDVIAGVTLSADARILASGDAAGTVALGSQKYQYRLVSENMTAPAFAAAFPSANPNVGDMLTSRWMALPKGFSKLGLSESAQRVLLNRIPTAASIADRMSHPAGTLTKGSVVEVSSQRAVILTDREMSLSIAATGRPYVLAMASRSQPDVTHWTFTDYGATATAAVPADAVDTEALATSIDAWYAAVTANVGAWGALSGRQMDTAQLATTLAPLVQADRDYVTTIQAIRVPEPGATKLAAEIQAKNREIEATSAMVAAAKAGNDGALQAAALSQGSAATNWATAALAVAVQLGLPSIGPAAT
jgi:hypothetical protein